MTVFSTYMYGELAASVRWSGIPKCVSVEPTRRKTVTSMVCYIRFLKSYVLTRKFCSFILPTQTEVNFRYHYKVWRTFSLSLPKFT